jgi:hypothetical protein
MSSPLVFPCNDTCFNSFCLILLSVEGIAINTSKWASRYMSSWRLNNLQIYKSFLVIGDIDKGKGHLMTCLCRHRGEAEVYLQPIHNLVLERGGCSAPHSVSFIFTQDRYPLYRRLREPGWRSGGHEKSRPHPNLTPEAFRSETYRPSECTFETEFQSNLPTKNSPDHNKSGFYDLQTLLLIILSCFASRVLECYNILWTRILDWFDTQTFYCTLWYCTPWRWSQRTTETCTCGQQTIRSADISLSLYNFTSLELTFQFHILNWLINISSATISILYSY